MFTVATCNVRYCEEIARHSITIGPVKMEICSKHHDDAHKILIAFAHECINFYEQWFQKILNLPIEKKP
uniref:Uncharacterized protein n=1 Tax=viral metagenome TaxID=1070528 RepID=A0A6M3LCR5_9ZZZZ